MHEMIQVLLLIHVCWLVFVGSLVHSLKYLKLGSLCVCVCDKSVVFLCLHILFSVVV